MVGDDGDRLPCIRSVAGVGDRLRSRLLGCLGVDRGKPGGSPPERVREAPVGGPFPRCAGETLTSVGRGCPLDALLAPCGFDAVEEVAAKCRSVRGDLVECCLGGDHLLVSAPEAFKERGDVGGEVPVRFVGGPLRDFHSGLVEEVADADGPVRIGDELEEEPSERVRRVDLVEQVLEAAFGAVDGGEVAEQVRVEAALGERGVPLGDRVAFDNGVDAGAGEVADVVGEPGQVDPAAGASEERQRVEGGSVHGVVGAHDPETALEPAAAFGGVVVAGPVPAGPLVDGARAEDGAGRVDPFAGDVSSVSGQDEILEGPVLAAATGEEVTTVRQDVGDEQRQHRRLPGTVAEPDDAVRRAAVGAGQVDGQVDEPIVTNAEAVDVESPDPPHQSPASPSGARELPKPLTFPAVPSAAAAASPSEERSGSRGPSSGAVSAANAAVSTRSPIPSRNRSVSWYAMPRSSDRTRRSGTGLRPQRQRR